MKLQSHSPDAAVYQSSLELKSDLYPEVTYQILRPSFSRRLDLTQRISELVRRLEFHEAGAGLEDRCSEVRLKVELDIMLLEWGLLGLDGLSIDGEPATIQLLLKRGPDDLTREIADRIRQECGLTEDERKN
jgi:hypothetical protein